MAANENQIPPQAPPPQAPPPQAPPPNTQTTQPRLSAWERLTEFFADQDAKGRQELKWSVALLFGIFVGLFLLLLFSWYSPPSRGHVLAVVLISAGAAMAMGLLVGFIFGIPRAVQADNSPGAKGPAFKANTNLEQISDWLTKIIVGVGLVQLATIPRKLQGLAAYFSGIFGEPLAGSASGNATVLLVFGYFGIFGFLLGYLWARIYLMKLFSEDETV